MPQRTGRHEQEESQTPHDSTSGSSASSQSTTQEPEHGSGPSPPAADSLVERFHALQTGVLAKKAALHEQRMLVSIAAMRDESKELDRQLAELPEETPRAAMEPQLKIKHK